MTDWITELDVGLLLALDALLKDPNVTRAATSLNITQSALSARLTWLRQVLNDPLFIPAVTGRGMIPTLHAMALHPDLTTLLERLGEVREGRIGFRRGAQRREQHDPPLGVERAPILVRSASAILNTKPSSAEKKISNWGCP